MSRLALLALFALSTGPEADRRAGGPPICPWCQDDPALMKAAGVVSHGGFEFGNGDTRSVQALLPTADIHWIATEHFEIGFAIGPHKVGQEEKEKIRAELGRLALALPAVKPKTKVLDPWLRSHLYAQRCEDIWKRFLELLQLEESDFPAVSGVRKAGERYMGEGPYLGQKGKYELLILPSEESLATFLKEQFGLLIRQTQRWNVIDRDTMIVVMHIGDGSLREDAALHGHVGFNLTINMLDGFKHYNYDTPIWLREGLGHFVEREINPEFNTFDSTEGAVADTSSKERWEPEVRQLIARGEIPRMAELAALKSYADLKLRHHFATWSMVDYLVRTNPAGFACLNDRLHGRLTADGQPDASNLGDALRAAFSECLGLSYSDFDRAWAEWVAANYGSQ